MNDDCKAKLKDMQKYVPPLINLIESLKEDPKAAKFKQIEVIHKVLTRPDSGITIDTLMKCEVVLKKVFDNSLKRLVHSEGSSADENSLTVKDKHSGSSSLSDSKIEKDTGNECSKLSSALSTFDEMSKKKLNKPQEEIIPDDSKQEKKSPPDQVDNLTDLSKECSSDEIETKLKQKRCTGTNKDEDEISGKSTEEVEKIDDVQMHSPRDSKSENNKSDQLIEDEKEDVQKSQITDEDKMANKEIADDDDKTNISSEDNKINEISTFRKKVENVESDSKIEKDQEQIDERASEYAQTVENKLEETDQVAKVDEEIDGRKEEINLSSKEDENSSKTDKPPQEQVDESLTEKGNEKNLVSKKKVRESPEDEDTKHGDAKSEEKQLEEERVDEIQTDEGIILENPSKDEESVKKMEDETQSDKIIKKIEKSDLSKSEEKKEVKSEKSVEKIKEKTKSNETDIDKNKKSEERILKKGKEEEEEKSKNFAEKMEGVTKNNETAIDQDKKDEENDLRKKSKNSAEKMEGLVKNNETSTDQDKKDEEGDLKDVREGSDEKVEKSVKEMGEDNKIKKTVTDEDIKGEESDLKDGREESEVIKGEESDLNDGREESEEKAKISSKKMEEDTKNNKSSVDQVEKVEEKELEKSEAKKEEEITNPDKTGEESEDDVLKASEESCADIISKESISKDHSEDCIEEHKELTDSNDDNLLMELKTVPSDSSSPAQKEKTKQNNNSRDISKEKDTATSSGVFNIGGDENQTVKTIELKPKDPSEKAAVVYLVKKGTQKPMQTIELLDSDSDDDDVILVSAVGLKRRATVPKPIVQKRVITAKIPKPKVFNVSTQGKGDNKTLFAITSVKSIGRVVKTTTGISPQKSHPQPFSPAGQRNTTMQRSFQKTSPLVQSITQKSTASSPFQKRDFQNPKTSLLTPPSRNSRDNGVSIRFNTSIKNIPEPSKTTPTPAKDDKEAKALVDDFLTNILTPTQLVKASGIELLLNVLEFPKFCKVKSVIEKTRKLHVESQEKNMKPLNNEIIAQHEEIRSIFIRNNTLTDIGQKMAVVILERSVNTPNGLVLNKNRKRPRELQDDEYAPDVAVESVEETVADRIKSLRRECKTNRKQYFAYEDDDDTQFLEMLEAQERLEANHVKKKRTSTPKRSNGSTENSTEVKKLRLEEGLSFETPFETDLLTPTWVEGPAEGQHSRHFQEIEQELTLDKTAANDFVENYNQEEEQEEQESPPHEEVEEEEGLEEPFVPPIVPGEPYKNINRAHHCRSKYIDSCVLCGIKHNFVVAHYVNQHRETEVLISRLTQRDTDQLLNAINYGYLSARKATNTQYSATCIFCKREMTFTLRYWWEHYTMHTGEYSYECSKCSLRRPRRQHAQRHASNECKMGLATVKVRYHFDKLANRIQAFVCKLCNYIQLHEDNVLAHLKTQHDKKRKASGDIIRVVLLQISRPYQDCFDSTDYSDSNANNTGQFETGETSYQSFEDYSDLMLPSDDLSYRICDMLATDEAALATASGSGQTSAPEPENEVEESPTQATKKVSTRGSSPQ